jgi:hypothetical protein
MSDSLDPQILQQHTQGATSDAIYRLPHVVLNRVSRALGFFRDDHHLPPSSQKGRPKKLNGKGVTDQNLSSVRNPQKN